jgi:hypothetical protein
VKLQVAADNLAIAVVVVIAVAITMAMATTKVMEIGEILLIILCLIPTITRNPLWDLATIRSLKWAKVIIYTSLNLISYSNLVISL